MATTTNYGWTTPDDTALVKDGAAAIRTLGSSVDTTTKNLNPETTLGDISFRSSTSNVNTRLGIGSTSQVLTVTGGVPVWATPSSGGMTLISTTTLSGATTTLSSIPQTYNTLLFIINGMTANTGNKQLRALPNNVADQSTYVGVDRTTTYFKGGGTIELTATTDRTNNANITLLQINNYASTTQAKPITFYSRFQSSSEGQSGKIGGGGIQTSDAITSMVFDYEGTNTFAGGTVLLYGVK
jgi:hypothetical protein